MSVLDNRTSAGVVVAGLRARREEIVGVLFARVREVPDPVGEGDVEYVAGLRAAVAAAVDYGLVGVERGGAEWGERGWRSVPVPQEAVAQAYRAAQAGVSLGAVLQRYIAGHTLLWDYMMEEADHADLEGGELRRMSRAQSGLLERLTARVAEEYGRERERMTRSRDQRQLGLVRALLAGEGATCDALEHELGYELEAEHVGVIAVGAGARDLVRVLAQKLDRRLLCAGPDEETVWAWLGGERGLRMHLFENAMSAGGRSPSAAVALAVGEPAWGLEGWRMSHRQAQAALPVALRRPGPAWTRYAEVALLSSALKDEMLTRTLIEVYLAPLDDTHGVGRTGGGRGPTGAVLRETWRAYLAAERNASSAAVALRVTRKTVENRLRTIEERLGRTLHRCPAEIEIALQLDEISARERYTDTGETERPSRGPAAVRALNPSIPIAHGMDDSSCGYKWRGVTMHFTRSALFQTRIYPYWGGMSRSRAI